MDNIGNDPASQKTRDLVADGYRYYVPCYKPRHMILDRGKGSRLFDIEGQDYIDLGAGIGVNVLGHGHPDVVGALTTQAARLWHTSNIYFTEPVVNLAKSLVERTQFASRVFFCNSGAEANEAAIKLVRKWAAQRGRGPQDREIVTFRGSFHGRTLATVTATVQSKYQEGFEPLPAGFVHCDAFNDIEALAKTVSSKTAAVMLEPVQGEGGINPAAPGFLKSVREICDRHDALLVLDEVQCGMGRTGKLWCHMWEEDLQPDILTSAKALGGGFPIGALLAGTKVAEVFQFGAHGSTFGGNPMACAAALAVLKHVCDPALMANVLERSAQLRDALEAIESEYGIFEEVRGRGLMIGAELRRSFRGRSADLTEAARRHGVLVLQAGPDVLRLLPPLNITADELQEGLRRMETAIAEFMGNT